MSLKQRKIKFKPRIKLNHNIYNQTFGLNSAQSLGVIHQGCNPIFYLHNSSDDTQPHLIIANSIINTNYK